MDPSCPSCPSCHLPKILAQVSLSQFRHFALILNLKMSLLPLPDARDTSGPNDSGNGEVEDELLLELTDRPATTRGTKLSVLPIILFPCWLVVALDHNLFQNCSADTREDAKTYNM